MKADAVDALIRQEVLGDEWDNLKLLTTAILKLFRSLQLSKFLLCLLPDKS